MPHHSLDAAAEQFLALRERLIRTLGAQTVDVLVRRSLIEARLGHPVLATLRFEGGELKHDDEQQDVDPSEAARAFAALNIVMLVILARMLGNELARRLAEGIGEAELFEGGQRIGPR